MMIRISIQITAFLAFSVESVDNGIESTHNEIRGEKVCSVGEKLTPQAAADRCGVCADVKGAGGCKDSSEPGGDRTGSNVKQEGGCGCVDN